MAPDPLDEIPVASSNLATIYYDRDTSQLYIRFKSGTRYRYDGCPKAVYELLKAAPSKGKFFAARIKNAYTCVKV